MGHSHPPQLASGALMEDELGNTQNNKRRPLNHLLEEGS